MALDIVKEYITILSEFFVFSDMAVTTPPVGKSGPAPLLPEDTNALTTAHHLMKVLTEIQDNVNEVKGMEISSETGNILKGLLESARWRFVDILVQAWLRGSSLLPEG